MSPRLLGRLRAWCGAPEAPRVERCTLHLFGKLPISKEFICVGDADAAARELRHWLSGGFSRHWAVEHDGLPIPPHLFLLRLPATGRSVAGCLWGSCDEAGLRQFPFAVFVALAPGSPGARPRVALGFLDVLQELVAEIRDRDRTYPDVAAFHRTYRRRTVVLRLREPAIDQARHSCPGLDADPEDAPPTGLLVPLEGDLPPLVLRRAVEPRDILLLRRPPELPAAR
jgi:type VI secretion system ImpM family protein